jgi:heme A synthase
MKALHRFALFTASLTFVLLLMGGLVHNTRSSLACPDWPLCYGQVLPKMEGRVAIEHSHRLVASTVGVLTIVLLVWLWRTGERKLRRAGALALVLVCAQGLLGGITVIYRLPTWVSTAHLAVSQLFFCTLIFIAFRTRPRAVEPLAPRARTLTAWAAGLTYVQMVMGALMRHLGVGLACVDVPLCRGSLWPADATPALGLHMLHRMFALVVLGVVLATSTLTFRAARGRTGVRAIALLVPLLVCTQIGLGLWSITSFLDVVPVTAHLGVAAAILASLVSLHLTARGHAGAATVVERPLPVGAEVIA